MCPRKENPRLTSKRARVGGTGQIPPHDVSRHGDFGDVDLSHPHLPDKFHFAQGTLFPSHVKLGDITKISQEVENEYHKYQQGQPNNVTNVQPADAADRITVKIKSHGVKKVGAFMRRGQAATVFPEEGYKPLEHKGERGKKVGKIIERRRGGK